VLSVLRFLFFLNWSLIWMNSGKARSLLKLL
jgi:hypothetical protein